MEYVSDSGCLESRFLEGTVFLGEPGMISVKNLEKRYGDLMAVKDVSFEVNRGEIVGLLGHNAAGKTTIMKIITGYLEPTSGKVTVGNVDVLTDRLAVQKQIGYMPENAPLYGEMLAQEYLLMMAELRGIAPDQCVKAVAAAATAAGVEKVLTQRIATLSKGYRQRVALCQAIVHQPAVLILDEPTNGLDPVQIIEIRHLIKKLAEKSTVILSTHILPEIEAVCGRVLILIDGELAKDAPLNTLLTSNRVKISLPADAREVQSRLKAVDGVTSANRSGADPARAGFELWEIGCTQPTPPIPALVRAAGEAGWEVGQVAAETASLEHIFSGLMKDYAGRRMAGSQQEVTP
jgi:ABC-2 type transport system ATP-binding protein